VLKHVDNVLVLGKGNGAIGAVPDDFNTKEELGFTQVSQFEVFGEFEDGLIE
jgi:hypothetical protein